MRLYIFGRIYNVHGHFDSSVIEINLLNSEII